MGNTISANDCVNVDEVLELIHYDDYTVTRTSGELESGWVIGPIGVGAEWIKEHAFKKEGTWRVFLNNNQKDPNLVLYGWRHLDKIFPSSLKEHHAEILYWREMVIGKLDALETKRLADQLNV
jgi:hypothetical protein